MCPCSKCAKKLPHPEFFGKPLYTRSAWFILSLSMGTWCFDRLNRTVRGDALHCAALCCTVLRYSKQGTRSKFIEVFSARQICLAAAYSIVHRIYLILCGFLCGNNLYFLICFLYSLSLRIL